MDQASEVFKTNEDHELLSFLKNAGMAGERGRVDEFSVKFNEHSEQLQEVLISYKHYIIVVIIKQSEAGCLLYSTRSAAASSAVICFQNSYLSINFCFLILHTAIAYHWIIFFVTFWSPYHQPFYYYGHYQKKWSLARFRKKFLSDLLWICQICSAMAANDLINFWEQTISRWQFSGHFKFE